MKCLVILDLECVDVWIFPSVLQLELLMAAFRVTLVVNFGSTWEEVVENLNFTWYNQICLNFLHSDVVGIKKPSWTAFTPAFALCAPKSCWGPPDAMSCYANVHGEVVLLRGGENTTTLQRM